MVLAMFGANTVAGATGAVPFAGAPAVSSAGAASAGIGAAGMLGIAYTVGKEILGGMNRKKAAKREMKDFATTGNLLLQQASDIQTLGGFDELEFREQTGYELASMEALFADAGAGLTGSTIDVLLATKRRFEIDALKIRETTKREESAARTAASQSFRNADYAKDAAEHSFFGLFG